MDKVHRPSDSDCLLKLKTVGGAQEGKGREGKRREEKGREEKKREGKGKKDNGIEWNRKSDPIKFNPIQ
jgi:hypothetical protein